MPVKSGIRAAGRSLKYNSVGQQLGQDYKNDCFIIISSCFKAKKKWMVAGLSGEGVVRHVAEEPEQDLVQILNHQMEELNV